MVVEIYFDGACKNVKDSKHEPLGVGVAVFLDGKLSKDDCIVHSSVGTSNIAEWHGCVLACELASKLLERYSVKELTIYSDSQLIVNQFNDNFQINDELFKGYYSLAKSYSSKFNKGLQLKWVKRELNTVADELSKEGLKQKRDDTKTIHPTSTTNTI